MTTIQAHYGQVLVKCPDGIKKLKEEKLPVAHPDILVGVELEIENFPRTINWELSGFNFEEDGSLRNGGLECVTTPTAVKHLENKLLQLFHKFKITPNNYSDRCSTHVHVNVQPYTFEQLKNICLTYQVFERLLFKFVGNERENNIFCVPWNQAGLSHRLVRKIEAGEAVRNWVKYTALNLLPVMNQGTIEFRHLHGTCDVPTIITWVNLITSIVNFGANVSFTELKESVLQLNTISNYDNFVSAVFGEFSSYLFKDENDRLLMSQGVLDAKLMFVNSKQKQAKVYTSGPIDRMLNELEREPFPGVIYDDPTPAFQPPPFNSRFQDNVLREFRQAVAAAQRAPEVVRPVVRNRG